MATSKRYIWQDPRTEKTYFQFGGIKLTLSRETISKLLTMAYRATIANSMLTYEQGYISEANLKRKFEDYIILNYKSLADEIEVLPLP